MDIKVFGLYTIGEISVQDPGLKRVVSLEPKFLPKSHGRSRREFAKTRINVIERLINILQVPGSRGKKHRIITSWNTGKYNRNAKIVIDAFKIIEKKTGKNPIEIFVRAIENAAPKDEVTTIEYGGARYPQAVDISPMRRINLVLRFIVHGAYDKAFNKKVTITEAIAREILLASENNAESFAIQKRIDLEKQADSAR
ncbi:MAG: 30S ribosomal protein S7 [Nanoarchaeota archaeon]